MSEISLILVLQKTGKTLNDMAKIMQAECNQACLKLPRRSLSYAKIQIKSEKLTPFGKIFQIMKLFNII